MFTKPTVIILGAGASRHYGYPTGEELVDEVVKQSAAIIAYYAEAPNGQFIRSTYNSTHPNHCREESAFHIFIQQLKDVSAAIKSANPVVIDYFLGHNKELQDIGKLLIAMVIMKHEKNNLPPPKTKGSDGVLRQENDWVRFIVNEMTSGCTQPDDLVKKNDITFITFNYDLSLEQRINLALSQYRYFSNAGAVEQFFKNGKIHHIYGKLREFYPANPFPKIQGIFSGDELKDRIDAAYEASRNLRTIAPEEKETSPEIARAIERAEHVYVLGYGFDKTNSTLLQLGQRSTPDPKWQHVHYTNLGNRNQINKRVAKIFSVLENNLSNEQFIARDPIPYKPQLHFTCEKSVKNVYRALAEDFDWPD